jgi:hypothetical protein
MPLRTADRAAAAATGAAIDGSAAAAGVSSVSLSHAMPRSSAASLPRTFPFPDLALPR